MEESLQESTDKAEEEQADETKEVCDSFGEIGLEREGEGLCVRDGG